MADKPPKPKEGIHFVSTDTTETLLLPSIYIPRSLKHLTPSETPCNIDIIMKESELLSLPPKGPFLIFSLPGHGSTSLLVSLIAQVQENYPNRWLSYMSLKKASEVISKSPDTKWTLPKLICEYGRIFDPRVQMQIHSFFPYSSTSSISKKARYEEYIGELFLDGLDDLLPETADKVLSILRGIQWKSSKVRVWMSSRTHLKSKVRFSLEEVEAFEVVPFTREQQMLLLFTHWKTSLSCQQVTEHRLKTFVTSVYQELEKLIPRFDKTIGACPSHCLFIRDFFPDIGKQLEGVDEGQVILVDISVTRVFEEFVKRILNSFLDKIVIEQGAVPVNQQWRDNEYRRINRLMVRMAILMYPSFCRDLKDMLTTANIIEHECEVFRVGLMYENNGKVQFIHKMYAEFLLAQYFVDSGRLKNTGLFYINFFLNQVLFDEEAKGVRMFLDSYLNLQQERKVMKKMITWRRLRQFLTDHYYLDSNKDNTAKYEEIENNGSILHIFIMEKHFHILYMILDSFRGFQTDLGRLLRIKVNMEVFKDNPFSKCPSPPETHIVSTFQLIAMFGSGSAGLQRTIRYFYQSFGEDGIRSYFKDGSWTPLHYAAMNSNFEFLQVLFEVNRQIKVNARSPDGRLPLHMVLTGQWYYSIKIVDNYVQSTYCKSSPKKCTTTASPSQTGSNKAKGKNGSKLKVAKRGTKEIWCFQGIEKDIEGCENYPDDESSPLHPIILTTECLLRNGADVNGQQPSDGKSVLHQAASLDSAKVVKLLVEHGANVRLQDEYGRTPAHYAALHGNEQVLKILVERGSAIREKDKYGFSVSQLLVNSQPNSNLCIIS